MAGKLKQVKKLLRMKSIFMLPALAVLWACSGNSQNISKDSSKLQNESGQALSASDSTQDKSDTSLQGLWVLQPVLASDTAAGKLPSLNFNLAASSFSGSTGCNSMNGSFTISGDSLIFNQQVVTTRMACPGYNEKAFLDNLFLTNNFKIEDGVLMLKNNQTVLSKWTRKREPKKLEKA